VTSSHPAETPEQFSFGRWAAAVAIALVVIGLTALAVRHVELVTGRYVAGGVPPIPAVAALLLLVAIRALLGRAWGGRYRLQRGQILLAYSMVSLGVFMSGLYVVRAFLPHLVSIQYWQSRNNPALARWAVHVPDWYAPADAEALRGYFEGSRGAGVPWQLWAVPLLRWTLLFVALFVVTLSLMALLRRQWLHHERLSFPLLYLPLSLTQGDRLLFDGVPLFRHPLLWSGIGAAALFNGLNIARALNPAIPAPGFMYAFQGQFPDPPWQPFDSVKLFYMLEAIGFGYFIPLEISFSAWFFYLAEKFLGVTGYAAGYEGPGFPYLQDQSAGAYLAAAALVLYGARKHLAGIVRGAFGRNRPASPEEREEHTALFAFLGGLAFILAWCWTAGFSPLVAVPFFLVLLCFILVYARIRAETGVPYAFTYPYGLPKEMLVNALTARGTLELGGERSWVIFSSFAWLSRHQAGHLFAAESIDAMKLSEESRIPRHAFYAALGIAFLVGLALAFWSHLEAFYAVGSNLAGGGKNEYRAGVALQEYQRMATLAAANTPRDLPKLIAQGGGLFFALGLGVLRTLWVRSPFHPLGFILATCYGDHTTLFFPMLAAWFCKALVLRLGGLPLYRRFIPFFLGLIIGHYFVGGIFWPFFSLLLAPEASQSYHILFGG